MKRRNKKWLVLTLILLIAFISVLAFFFLTGQNSEGKKEYQEQIKQEAQIFTNELVSELDQIDTSNIDIKIKNEDPLVIQEKYITEYEKKLIEAELNKIYDARKQEVLKTLTIAYSHVLDEQKQEALRLVNSLIDQGKEDWQALVSKGENTAANKGMLASEYFAKSKVLEKQMDESFRALISKMEEQLKMEGIDPTTIIEEYKAEYQRIKEENRSELMKKAMDAL